MATTLIESLNWDNMDLMKKCIETDMKLVYKSKYAPAQIQKCRWGWVGRLPTLVAQFEMNAVHLKRQTNPTDPLSCFFEPVIMKLMSILTGFKRKKRPFKHIIHFQMALGPPFWEYWTGSYYLGCSPRAWQAWGGQCKGGYPSPWGCPSPLPA